MDMLLISGKTIENKKFNKFNKFNGQNGKMIKDIYFIFQPFVWTALIVT